MRTYKFRLYPSAGQEKLLIKQLDLCRELYNAFLEQRILAYKTEKRINYNYQQDQIPELKKTFPEFKDIHSQVLQDVARRVDKAYDNFYRRIQTTSLRYLFPHSLPAASQLLQGLVVDT